MHGWSTGIDYQFTQIDVVADALPNNAISVQYLTSAYHKATLAGVPAGSFQGFNDTATNTPYERRKAFGISTNGRWIRPVIKLSGQLAANTQPVLHSYTVTGAPVGVGVQGP